MLKNNQPEKKLKTKLIKWLEEGGWAYRRHIKTLEQLKKNLPDEYRKKNSFEVIDELQVPNLGQRHGVTLLISGIPFVQIELKAPGVPVEDAMKQINGYLNDQKKKTYGIDILCSGQIFIAANGKEVYYRYRDKDIWSYLYHRDGDQEQPLNLEDFTKYFLHPDVLLKQLFPQKKKGKSAFD